MVWLEEVPGALHVVPRPAAQCDDDTCGMAAGDLVQNFGIHTVNASPQPSISGGVDKLNESYYNITSEK